MKPSLSEDITSMVAIAVGASITIGLTAAPLLRESVVPTDRAQVVRQNVPVLRNDRSITRDENGQAAEINFVMLLVTPAEAEMLAMAETTGSLHFAVRAALPTISMPEGKRESGVLRRMPR